MHGIVHAELQKFVITRHGRPVWQELLKGAGLGSKKLPDLSAIPGCRHRCPRNSGSVVRLRNPGAAPPGLRCRRVAPAEVHLSYDSNRQMCAVARGIIRGVAKHFGESVTIVESTCMHSGAPSCEISIRLTAPSQGRRVS